MTHDEMVALAAESGRLYWGQRQAEAARQKHRRKAELAFGEGVVAEACALAAKASHKYVLGGVVAEAKLQREKIAGVIEHLRKALRLVDEARDSDGTREYTVMGDGRLWRHLDGVLESALVAASESEKKIQATFQPIARAKPRASGKPSARAEFVRLAVQRCGRGNASPASWLHLGIAAGIDEPATDAKFRQMSKDYRDLLNKHTTST